MDRGHSIGAVRADNRQVRHSDLALITLFDQAHALNPPLVSREARANIVEQAPVNLVDNLQMTGQQYLETMLPAISQELPAAACDWYKQASSLSAPKPGPIPNAHRQARFAIIQRPPWRGGCH